MATIDKAAIGWTIGIVAVAIGVALAGTSGANLNVPTSAPSTPTATESTPSGDAFANVAAQVKSQAEQREAAMKEQMKMSPGSESSVSLSEATVTKTPTAPAAPQTVTVTIPAGSSTPGCEESNECFIPDSVTINTGDTVSWENTDTAAHTVTSGTPADGPDGTFDSSLLMGSASFEVTFDESGSYDYFCMVHPWMVGNVQVN